ncbi:MAG: SDR family oxidoreductase [Acidimicrobiales bacterium]
MSKAVLITGAGSGFGRGAALGLAERGHSVIATTETTGQRDALQSESSSITAVKVDVTDLNDVEQVRTWDIDVVLNNAGAGETGPLADVPMDRVRHLFEVNVFGTLAVTQAALPKLISKGSGRIIIVSSIAGVLSGPAFGPYSMTKHALEAMGKAMRAELEPLGIDVTLLNPGPFATGFNDRMAASMWDWFDDDSLNAPATELFRAMEEMVTTGQMDPQMVVDRMIELVEAETTSENNFVPPDIIDLLTAQIDA